MEWQTQESRWQGFKRLDFVMDGHPALLVCPETPAAGRPWIWRTEFFGHEPQGDLALLSRGWHVAYLGISNLYGAPSAIATMGDFFERMVAAWDLAGRVILEGLSRGGLYAFNFAATYPGRTAGLYLDAPVLDIRSWPGGLGVGPGAPNLWTSCLEYYGLNESTVLSARLNPLDRVETVAAARIPILLIAGDADEVVPLAENSAILLQRYWDLGCGSLLTVIIKPGCRHHPHSVPDGAVIADWAERHSMLSSNPSSVTPPGSANGR